MIKKDKIKLGVPFFYIKDRIMDLWPVDEELTDIIYIFRNGDITIFLEQVTTRSFIVLTTNGHIGMIYSDPDVDFKLASEN